MNFGSPSNATYANLQALVQAGVDGPDDAFDPVYHGPRWDGSYNNANFALLARVVLPKLVNPAINLTAAKYADRDLTSGTIYKKYVRDEIFEPLGVFGADLDVTDPTPTLGYMLGVDAPGEEPVDRTRTGGAGGWKLSARDLSRFLDGIQRDNSILSAATRTMRDAQELGWYQTENAFGESFSHNGANGGTSGFFRSQIVAMPGDVEVGFLMNSGWSALPGGNIFNMLETAYTNAWSDLTVEGTSGPDDFVLRLDNSGLQPSIEVELNGEVLFSHWISTFDSLTLDGLGGGDTFTVLGWDASIDLNINGGSGNDVVNVLPGFRNMEMVAGMTFAGGTGADRIVVNDQFNPYSNAVMSRMYTVASTSVARFRQNPAFPGNVGMFLPVAVNYSSVEDLDCDAGGGNDVVTVASQTSGTTRVRTGNGDDVIVVGQTAGNLETVDGLEVDGQAGLDEIRLFDHNKTSADPQATAQYDVNADSASRYMASLGGISNGPPVSVGVEFDNVENLQLTTTGLPDVIRVHATPTGVATINGGAGGDTLVTSPDGRNLELVDDLTFNGDAGLDAIVLNDQDNPYSYPASSGVYDVTALGVSRTASMVAGQWLLPTAINVAYASVEELTLRTGGEDDEVNVENLPSGGATIHTGPGDDVVYASPTAGNLETVHGLEVDGGAGVDALEINDVNNPYELPGGADYTITPSSVFRYGEHPLLNDFVMPGEVDFTGFESMSLSAGNQSDRFDVEGVGGTAAVTLDGNGGADDFHVTSPAFASLVVRGEGQPLFGADQLVVNENGLYAVATIPGLYPIGSGALTIDTMTLRYSGIEQRDIHAQVYGGPGDFDSNGLVNNADLTDAALGWGGRLGDDLDGFDFLTWQRNYGVNRLPRGGRMAAASDDLAAAPAEKKTPMDEVRFDDALLGLPMNGDDDAGDARFALAYEEPAWRVAPTAPTKNFVAGGTTALAVSAIGLGSESDDDREVDDAEWDAAFESLGAAFSLAM